MKTHLFKQKVLHPVHNEIIKRIYSLYFPKEEMVFQEVRENNKTEYKFKNDNRSIKYFISSMGQTSWCIGQTLYVGQISFTKKEFNGLKKLVKIYEEQEKLENKLLNLKSKKDKQESILFDLEGRTKI